MKYITVCSGIGPEYKAWDEALGWVPQAVSEIARFPSAVLAHHRPKVSNLGDMTKIDWRPYAGTTSLLAGGTPCQSFSLAGLGRGLDDPRGQLVFGFLRAARDLCVDWFVWENVYGVLSQRHAPAFRAFLLAAREIGYSVAWRLLDAQYFGIAQQRRRVFVVGRRGSDWRGPAAVLLEPEALFGNHAPGRKAWPETTSRALAGDRVHCPEISPTLTAVGHDAHEDGTGKNAFVVTTPEKSPCLLAHHSARQSPCDEPFVIEAAQITSGENRSNPGLGKPCPSLSSTGRLALVEPAVPRIRDLIPEEREALMGLPRGYTRIAYRGRSAEQCPPGPRNHAIGNSIPVPMLRWLGERIAFVHRLTTKGALCSS